MLQSRQFLQYVVQRNAVKAVIFDMGGVILPSPNPAITRFEKEKRIPRGTVIKCLASNGADSYWAKLERGEVDAAEFERGFALEMERQCGERCETSGLIDFIESELAHPIGDTIEALDKLKELGIPTALLTNNWFVQKGITNVPEHLKDKFDVVIESALLGERKPEPKMYEAVLEALELKGEETVFLDDIGANLKAANKHGIQTIKVTGGHPQNALHELQAMLNEQLVTWPRGTTPIREGMDLDRAKLRHYLENSLGLVGDELELRQFDHGQSNPTYYIRFGVEELVLRKKPPGKLLRGAHMVEREAKVMKALGEAGVPMPEILDLVESNDEICGTPFYIMRYIHGRVFKTAHLSEVPKEQRKEIYFAVVEALAKVHECDPVKIGLEDYGKLDGYLARQIKTWTKQYRAAEIDKEIWS